MPGTVRLTTLGSKRGINILAADHVKAQKIRRAAGGASAGHNADDVLFLDELVVKKELLR